MNNNTGFDKRFYFWLAVIIVGMVVLYTYIKEISLNPIVIVILAAILIGAGFVAFRGKKDN